MTVYKLPECTPVDSLPQGAAICLGNFDGVHIGHQRLFDSAKELSQNGTCTCSAVWSFTSLAKPCFSAPFITDNDTKLALFAEYGLDYAVLEDFECVRNMECPDFVSLYLVEKLRAGAVICGYNFSFGLGGAGDSALLSELLSKHSVPAVVVPCVTYGNNTAVSSTAVREMIESGNISGAAELLGHPFSVSFPVVHGNQIGRTIGIPTINQSFPEGHIVPLKGIYACTAFVDGEIFLGVANVGVRPTVSDGDTVNCETHIINYSGDLYGKHIRVEFYEYLRDEMKFESVDALRRQIKIDISATLDYFCTVYG